MTGVIDSRKLLFHGTVTQARSQAYPETKQIFSIRTFNRETYPVVTLHACSL